MLLKGLSAERGLISISLRSPSVLPYHTKGVLVGGVKI